VVYHVKGFPTPLDVDEGTVLLVKDPERTTGGVLEGVLKGLAEDAWDENGIAIGVCAGSSEE
jgi:hypothetical protein